MVQVRSSIMGVAGTQIRLTVRKPDGRTVDLTLLRGSPEYWHSYDEIQRLKRDLTNRTKELELHRKNMIKHKLTLDLEREQGFNMKGAAEATALNAEKKGLDEQIAGLMKQISELQLLLQSSQNSLREMANKARQAELARENEAKMCKQAEERESKAHGLLLEEIQRRKESENTRAVLEQRLLELEEQLKRDEGLPKTVAKLQVQTLELQGRLGGT
mmetsp:Transcript_47674/g.116067  ORF Transcript_47674/g.116067 Transcript_47674/m.116067 type:complete len:216 (+) Transcript_47674:339-986(+)